MWHFKGDFLQSLNSTLRVGPLFNSGISSLDENLNNISMHVGFLKRFYYPNA